MWIAAFTFVGEVLNNLLPLPVPAGVYGMLLLLFALMIGIVKLLMDNLAAVLASITAGTVSSLLSILLMGKLFGLSNEHITTLLPKSITTAIGMGASQEAGGIVTLTVAGIVMTGILGNMIAETVFHVFHIDHPIARGLALGTSAHAVGTAKALELGEIEGAMSSLSICVAGVLTVILVPVISGIALQ